LTVSQRINGHILKNNLENKKGTKTPLLAVVCFFGCVVLVANDDEPLDPK